MALFQTDDCILLPPLKQFLFASPTLHHCPHFKLLCQTLNETSLANGHFHICALVKKTHFPQMFELLHRRPLVLFEWSCMCLAEDAAEMFGAELAFYACFGASGGQRRFSMIRILSTCFQSCPSTMKILLQYVHHIKCRLQQAEQNSA